MQYNCHDTHNSIVKKSYEKKSSYLRHPVLSSPPSHRTAPSPVSLPIDLQRKTTELVFFSYGNHMNIINYRRWNITLGRSIEKKAPKQERYVARTVPSTVLIHAGPVAPHGGQKTKLVRKLQIRITT